MKAVAPIHKLTVPDDLRAEHDRHRQEQYRHRLHRQRKQRDKLRSAA